MLTPATDVADPTSAGSAQISSVLNDISIRDEGAAGGPRHKRTGRPQASEGPSREEAARMACAPIDLVQGLPVAVVREKLNIGVRMQDTGSRLLAFYLVEMEGRRLYQDTGHSSAVHYAESRLGMEPRRSRELLAVGKKLLELPRMDEAFCRGEISWTQVVMLTRVVSPEHEEAWLLRARESSCRELALEVKRTRPGGKPRDPEDRKGLAEIRFPISAQVSGLAFQKWELAKKQLGEERGTPISDAECMEILASLLLSTEEDGSLPGRKRARSSLFRLVVRQESPANQGELEDSAGSLPRASLETEEGLVPLDRPTLECIRCDAESMSDDGEHLEMDSKTSAALRERVLTRDGHRCRSCQSRFELMVHHIQPRSKLGRTQASNMITVCMRCHGLVHADLLILLGKDQASVRFVDREGHALHDKGAPLPPSVLTRLDRRRAYDALGEPMGQALSRSLARRLAKTGRTAHEENHGQNLADDPSATTSDDPSTDTLQITSSPSRKWVTAEDIPAEADVYWWRKHSHLFHPTKGGRFRFEPGFVVESPKTPYLLSQDRSQDRSHPDTKDSARMPRLALERAPWLIRIGHPAAETSASQAAPSHPSLPDSEKTAFERRFSDCPSPEPKVSLESALSSESWASLRSG